MACTPVAIEMPVLAGCGLAASDDLWVCSLLLHPYFLPPGLKFAASVDLIGFDEQAALILVIFSDTFRFVE
jgi:hypothetical protein